MKTQPLTTKIDGRGGQGRAGEFNRDCLVPTLDRRALAEELARLPGGGGALVGEGSSFFADSPVFVDEACLGRQAGRQGQRQIRGFAHFQTTPPRLI